MVTLAGLLIKGIARFSSILLKNCQNFVKSQNFDESLNSLG